MLDQYSSKATVQADAAKGRAWVAGAVVEVVPEAAERYVAQVPRQLERVGALGILSTPSEPAGSYQCSRALCINVLDVDIASVVFPVVVGVREGSDLPFGDGFSPNAA